jgi:hypothetical protein
MTDFVAKVAKYQATIFSKETKLSGRAAGIENLEMKTAKHEKERWKAPGCGWVLDGLPKDDARLIMR